MSLVKDVYSLWNINLILCLNMILFRDAAIFNVITNELTGTALTVQYAHVILHKL